MTEKKTTLQQDAMYYGTLMGIFWTLKFILFPLGMTMPVMLVAFFILTFIGVPVLGVSLVRQYRDRVCQGTLPFSRAFLFTTFMYMFAALFATIAHYIYFRYMDNGMIVNTYQGMIDQMNAVATGDMKESLEQFRTALDVVSSLTPLEITLQLLTQNVFYCSILAIPTGLLVMRNKKKE